MTGACSRTRCRSLLRTDIDRNAAVRHKANHSSKSYNRSTSDRNPMQTKVMAEGEGFEPPVRFPVQRFSRPPVSTAHPSLRTGVFSSLAVSAQFSTILCGSSCSLPNSILDHGWVADLPSWRVGIGKFDSKLVTGQWPTTQKFLLLRSQELLCYNRGLLSRVQQSFQLSFYIFGLRWAYGIGPGGKRKPRRRNDLLRDPLLKR